MHEVTYLLIYTFLSSGKIIVWVPADQILGKFSFFWGLGLIAVDGNVKDFLVLNIPISLNFTHIKYGTLPSLFLQHLL